LLVLISDFFSSYRRLPHLNVIIGEVADTAGMQLDYKLLSDLDYADDVYLVADDGGKVREEKLPRMKSVA